VNCVVLFRSQKTFRGFRIYFRVIPVLGMLPSDAGHDQFERRRVADRRGLVRETDTGRDVAEVVSGTGRPHGVLMAAAPSPVFSR
jgi:hypothetical protein